MRANGWPRRCLVLCALTLTGCSTQPVVTTPIACEPAKVPAPLLRAHPLPARSGDTNRELLHLVADLASAVQRCNADKAAIRRWSDRD